MELAIFVIPAKAGDLARGFERLAHGADGVALPFDDVVVRDHPADCFALPSRLRLDFDGCRGPTADMSEQAVWELTGGRRFFVSRPPSARR
ncbi:hypothetical protein [Mesorhizobium sp. M4A.F.Ca.ET.020.02.1.1]|uniref:hypothetical protein n=1 Tax=Mesorhizobium sp. M4A.F.Ca.ET.020.02.1.1 TaxID=2496652 RepID=UPI00167819A5|nr:hypothetical protein [Mesorhizobium sp. M4A.F.Ca.ET.020.02.1.1]